jgi:hypothetical protein
MKKILVIGLLALVVLYVIKRMIYEPYMWKRAINTPEHSLRLGSYIFSKERGHNGSQSFETHYFIFKVIAINGDYVRLSVVRRLSEKGSTAQSDFSTTNNDFEALKTKIHDITVTGILREDLYRKNQERYVVNDFLLEKYPALKTSRYYFEDLPAAAKNLPAPSEHFDGMEYFSLLYSKEEIISKGKLRGWILNNSTAPELSGAAKDIELIQNQSY